MPRAVHVNFEDGIFWNYQFNLDIRDTFLFQLDHII